MLPLQLLRVTTRKGAIRPLYCTEGEEVKLAAKIIKEVEESFRKEETRGQLEKRVASLESASASPSHPPTHSTSTSDFKLVRGLYALLGRRCTFQAVKPVDKNGNTVEPASLRKAVFEESSRRGFALTDLERKEIALAACAKLGIDLSDANTDAVGKAMFCDFEENHVLRGFEALAPEALVGWYNLSLMQTLLFNCTRMQFSVSGGQNWKRVLRNVKWLGLMYNLEEKQAVSGDASFVYSSSKSTAEAGRVEANVGKVNVETETADIEEENERNTKTRKTSKAKKGMQEPSGETANPRAGSGVDPEGDVRLGVDTRSKLLCTLDGPLSLFKMTDRYGTSIAKLLPAIVKSDKWSVDAWIVRKTMSGKKMYEFHTSDIDVPEMLFDPYEGFSGYESSSAQSGKLGRSDADAGRSGGDARDKEPKAALFDSNVEEKFANKVAQSSLPAAGWTLEREPDPLVLPGGGVFIPDFMFEKKGSRKVYVEIVGFWTKEYLERKTKKIADLVGDKIGNSLVSTAQDPNGIVNAVSTKEPSRAPGTARRDIDIFVAVNEELACSKLVSMVSRNRLIFYRNDSVPLGPIVDYLKSLDRQALEGKASDPSLRAKIEEEIAGSTQDIISITDVAGRYGIPLELAIEILNNNEEGRHIVSDNYLISKSKARLVKDLLESVSKFAEASSILSANSIPETCHAELVGKLGYQVVWKSFEPDSAVIVKRKEKSSSE